MAEKYDEEIIELTEVVEEDDSEADEDFLKELESGSFFDQPSTAPESSDSSEDEVSKFFASGPLEPEELKTETAAVTELPPEPVSPETGSDDDFASFLEDIEEDLQMKQTPKEKQENSQAILAIEKQWEETLESAGEPQEEAVDSALLEETAPEPAPEPGMDAASIDAVVGEQTVPVAVTVSEEMLEAAVTKAVKQVLEPLAERVFTETAERVLSREISRLMADIKSAEDELT